MSLRHNVVKNDTLSQIARQYEVDVQDIVAANGIKNPNLIYEGQQLIIPEKFSSTGSSTSNSNSGSTSNNKGWDYKDFTYDDFTYNDFAYSKYKESDAVKGAEDALNTHLANKPDEYKSQWQTQLKSLMDQIMDRDKFSYDLNGDALYQQYKDKYIQQGKLAMGDAIGQASAMTGGYGNSYAQSVGQQAYQAQLDNLNDIVPELYAMALDKYNMEGQELYNQYGMVADRENLDYGRYRDTVSDYLTERDYLQGRYDTERDFDYSKYVNDRDFAYDKYSADRALDYDKYSSDRALAYDEYATDKNLSYEEYRNAIADEQWKKEYDESVRQYNEQMAFQKQQYADSQKKNTSNPVINTDGALNLSAIPGINTNDSSYFDENGNFKKAEYLGSTQDGQSSFRIGGKTVVLDKGVNPYTQTYNKDCANGTFSNGYQPNNVNGKKLKKSNIQDYMNGVLQNVWKDTDGNLWIWDGTQNKYLTYQE